MDLEQVLQHKGRGIDRFSFEVSISAYIARKLYLYSEFRGLPPDSIVERALKQYLEENNAEALIASCTHQYEPRYSDEELQDF